MAHTDEILIHGIMTPVSVVDSSAQEIDDAANKAKFIFNKNILHNWYFVDPIDQRGGRFIPGGTTTYTDPALTSVTDKPPAAPKMVEVHDTYATYVTSQGEARYVPLSDVRRGYCGQIQMFDRWCGNNSDANCEITGSSVKFIPSPTSGKYSMTQQYIENPEQYFGKTVTLSILYANGELKTDTGVVPDAFPESEQYLCQVGNASLRLSSSKFRIMVSVPSTSSGSEYVAMKLEFGSVQTLARQEDGRWVLNEIPDKGMELLRCIQSTADSADTFTNKIILHTGNKPSGSYTGNGSAAERKIDTGGIGNCLAIYTQTNYFGFATPNGGILFNKTTGETKVFTETQVKYEAGVLTLAIANLPNSSSSKYYYSCL